MNLSSIKKISELKNEPDDWTILYTIATESGLYPLWLDDDRYRYLTNFLKYRYGIIVRSGYVFCKNDFACRIVTELSSIPYGKVIVMKGLF